LESTGHPDEALVALENALKLDPANARAIALRDRITEQKRSLDRPKSGAPTAENQEQAARLTPSPRQDDGGAAPATIASQRALLDEEDLSGVTGRKVAGSAIWRTEQAGDSIDRGLRADIEIPDRNLKLTLSLHRNRNPSLHASHTMDIAFAYSAASPSLRVNSIPGILMKADEGARGIPLAGVVVKVTDSVFLFGLSDVEADRARNVDIPKEQRWLDIPCIAISGALSWQLRRGHPATMLLRRPSRLGKKRAKLPSDSEERESRACEYPLVASRRAGECILSDEFDADDLLAGVALPAQGLDGGARGWRVWLGDD
jgi:hypothetical protein